MGIARPKVYQLHMLSCEISPNIWRRDWVGADSTIADLRDTLQHTMGYTNSHLNCFILHKIQYGVSAWVAGQCDPVAL